MWGGSGFPVSLSEWSFAMCPAPYNCKKNVLSVSLNKTFSFQLLSSADDETLHTLEMFLEERERRRQMLLIDQTRRGTYTRAPHRPDEVRTQVLLTDQTRRGTYTGAPHRPDTTWYVQVLLIDQTRRGTYTGAPHRPDTTRYVHRCSS